jgi:hypothetical protein
MIRKTLFAVSFVAGSTLAMSTPAMAWWGGTHTHYCNCGDSIGSSYCGSTTSGGSSTSSGGSTTSGGSSTSSGGTSSSSSGGTDVPEPGMLGMMGLGLLGLAYARRRKARA